MKKEKKNNLEIKEGLFVEKETKKSLEKKEEEREKEFLFQKKLYFLLKELQEKERKEEIYSYLRKIFEEDIIEYAELVYRENKDYTTLKSHKGDEAQRELITRIDRQRKIKHDALISSFRIFSRQALLAGLSPKNIFFYLPSYKSLPSSEEVKKFREEFERREEFFETPEERIIFLNQFIGKYFPQREEIALVVEDIFDEYVKREFLKGKKFFEPSDPMVKFQLKMKRWEVFFSEYEKRSKELKREFLNYYGFQEAA